MHYVSRVYYLSEIAENPALHIPDGFLSLPIALLCWALAIILLTIAVRQAYPPVAKLRW